MTAVLLTTTFVGVTAIHAEVPMKKVNITVENGSHASFVYVYAKSHGTKIGNVKVKAGGKEKLSGTIAANAIPISWDAKATKSGSSCQSGDAALIPDGSDFKATIKVTDCTDPKPPEPKKTVDKKTEDKKTEPKKTSDKKNEPKKDDRTIADKNGGILALVDVEFRNTMAFPVNVFVFDQNLTTLAKGYDAKQLDQAIAAGDKKTFRLVLDPKDKSVNGTISVLNMNSNNNCADKLSFGTKTRTIFIVRGGTKGCTWR